MSRRPRLVIAAPQGRSGKTTLTLGLCAAFNSRGLNVQPFKKGPDYIDPSWLQKAAGRPCYSLDPFFYQHSDSLLQAFDCYAQNADLSIVEGNHGLFDSFDENGNGSTAAVARSLASPILLVVNAARTGRSIAAIVHGCQTFEPDTNIAGIVLNNVAQGRHEARLRQAIESYCHIPVIGAIPRDDRLTIPDRHLGLIPSGEEQSYQSAIAACAEAVHHYLDLDAIIEIASQATSLPDFGYAQQTRISDDHLLPKIGILRDRAFTFYYPENLEALEVTGAKLIYIDSLRDSSLPPVDALYIGGGFPEIFMDELSANITLRESIRQAIEADLPVYAECGGLMYLSQRIVWGEKSVPMVGILPCEIEMTGKPQGHGYVVAEVQSENPFFQIGTVLRGHEFHNSRLISLDDDAESLPSVYKLSRGKGLGNNRDGLTYRNVLAVYTHLHTAGAPQWAPALVKQANMYRQTGMALNSGAS